MAEPQKKTHQTNRRGSRFLGCFGFSKKKKPPEKTIHGGSKKKTWLLSWPMFRYKTVPVDNTEKAETAHGRSSTSKLIRKVSETNIKSSPLNPRAEPVATTCNQASREKPKDKETKRGPEQSIILGNRKLSEPAARTGSSLPGSPNIKPKSKSRLSYTVSLPVLEGNKRVGNSRVQSLKKARRRNNEVVEKLDPVMGMSIIMVTLIIMLIWGRLCAILCTSAWFYFCPRFRTTVNNGTALKTGASSDDLDSEEYKKKVVLEGLLRRSHRVTP